MADKFQISDLTFDGIRTSLLNYLRTTDVFKDYDFEGSALRTLVDLLTYNTFYYGFYSNMIANEMFLDTAQLEKSMISLTKPLGYVVTSTAASTSTISLNNVNQNSNGLSYFSTFKGFDQNGSPYFFYNIDHIPIDTVIIGNVVTGKTKYFPIYEGKSRIFRQTIEIDLDTQTIFLEGKEIDPRTIVVEIAYEGGEYERLINYYTEPDAILDSTSKVFFIERKNNGYNLIFSKQSENDVNSGELGRPIGSTDDVRVSYLISSGSNSNSIGSFEFVSDSLGSQVQRQNETVEVIPLISSYGGRNEANLDTIRFFAPKTFAAQNRLVTKGDYYSLLNELGYSTNENPDFDFKVFGGEEATPRYFGRVFISILRLNPLPGDISELNEVNRLLSIAKNKSVVTVLPEYIPPLEIDVRLVINAILPGATPSVINSRRTSIINSLMSRYGQKKYNNNFTTDEIKDIVRSSAPGISINDEDIFIFASIQIASSTPAQIRRINFKNKISTSPIANVEITFTGDTTQIVRDIFQTKKLYLYRTDTNSLLSDVPVGDIDYDNGYITLYQNLPQLPSPFIITAKTIDSLSLNAIFSAKDEFVAYLKEENLQVNISPV